MNPLEIIIDTREQSPWHFPKWAGIASIGTLKTGDYALAGDDGFAIERKSLDDFCGTISSGWDRFLREIDRMEGWPAKVIIVEGDLSQCLYLEKEGVTQPPEHQHYKITPGFVMKRVAELTYKGVSVLFAHNAQIASAMCVAVLKRRQVDIMEFVFGEEDEAGSVCDS